jgi:hypothetical protein
MSKSYSELLLDPRWQKKRLEVLERAGWACNDCSDAETTLHVHHVYYTKGKKPWEYPDSALIALCATCHERVTRYTDQIIKEIGRAPSSVVMSAVILGVVRVLTHSMIKGDQASDDTLPIEGSDIMLGYAIAMGLSVTALEPAVTKDGRLLADMALAIRLAKRTNGLTETGGDGG